MNDRQDEAAHAGDRSGEPDPQQLLTALSTEHFTLQGADDEREQQMIAFAARRRSGPSGSREADARSLTDAGMKARRPLGTRSRSAG